MSVTCIPKAKAYFPTMSLDGMQSEDMERLQAEQHLVLAIQNQIISATPLLDHSTEYENVVERIESIGDFEARQALYKLLHRHTYGT